jgi:ubiquinone/menaquinone biosynthesis C-methylase UbiE
MLTMADYKAQQAGLNIDWRQGNAEKTPFVPHSFDLIAIASLFHELPPIISQTVLRECFRLLIPGGQILILDGNQKSLRQTDWLTNIFEEPYIQDYAKESVDAWLGNAQFEAVQSDDLWWVHQVSQGMKPTPIRETNFSTYENSNEVLVPAI